MKKYLIWSLVLAVIASCLVFVFRDRLFGSNQTAQTIVTLKPISSSTPASTAPKPGTDEYIKQQIKDYVAKAACEPKWKFKDCKAAGKVEVFAPGEKIPGATYDHTNWSIYFSYAIQSSFRDLVSEFLYTRLYEKGAIPSILEQRTAKPRTNILGGPLDYDYGTFTVYMGQNQFDPIAIPYKFDVFADTTNWVKCQNLTAGYEVMIPPDYKPFNSKDDPNAEATMTTCPLDRTDVFFLSGSYDDVSGSKMLSVEFAYYGDDKNSYKNLDDFVFSRLTNKPSELVPTQLDGEPAYWYTAPNGSNSPELVSLINGHPISIPWSAPDPILNSFIKNFKRIK